MTRQTAVTTTQWLIVTIPILAIIIGGILRLTITGR